MASRLTRVRRQHQLFTTTIESSIIHNIAHTAGVGIPAGLYGDVYQHNAGAWRSLLYTKALHMADAYAHFVRSVG